MKRIGNVTIVFINKKLSQEISEIKPSQIPILYALGSVKKEIASLFFLDENENLINVLGKVKSFLSENEFISFLLEEFGILHLIGNKYKKVIYSPIQGLTYGVIRWDTDLLEELDEIVGIGHFSYSFPNNYEM